MAKMSIAQAVRKTVRQIQASSDIAVPFYVDSGNYALNYIVSGSFFKGYPAGRITELFGTQSTGKSLLITQAIASVQKMGGIAILDDSERTFDPFFAEKVGVNVEDLLILNSQTLEDFKDPENPKEMIPGHYTSIMTTVKAIREQDPNIPILIALDSIAILTTAHEKEVGLSKVDMSKAKMVRQFMRLLTPEADKYKLCYLVSNHVTASMALYGKSTTTTGGSGVKYQSSVRLELKTKGKILGTTGKVKGVNTHVACEKSKITAPHKQCQVEVLFDIGMSTLSGVTDMLIVEEVIVQEGPGWFVIPGILDKKTRRKDIEDMMTNDIDFLKRVADKAKHATQSANISEKDFAVPEGTPAQDPSVEQAEDAPSPTKKGGKSK